MLNAIRDALCEAVSTDQVTDQVAQLIKAIDVNALSSTDLIMALRLSHRLTFGKIIETFAKLYFQRFNINKKQCVNNSEKTFAKISVNVP